MEVTHWARKLCSEGKRVSESSPLYTEIQEHISVIENALGERLIETVMDHVLRLRDCLEEVQEARREHNAKITFGIFAKLTPEYREAHSHLGDISDPQVREHLGQMLERGESYDAASQ